MKNNRFCVSAAMAVTLLSIGGEACAGSFCAALTGFYTSAATGNGKGLHGILEACRAQLKALPASPTAQASASGGDYSVFDFPDEDTFLGPQPAAINNAGVVVGSYFDNTGHQHSFMRTRDGTLTAFDPPGTVCGGALNSNCSGAGGISTGGVITGAYQDANMVIHGYLRNPDGTFVTIDVPGAENWTNPFAINAAGTITGYYSAGNNEFHGFLRQANGIYTNFDPPGSAYTSPSAINSPGGIAGYYQETNPGLPIGFVRSANGNIVTFNAPGGGILTVPWIALNAKGTVSGSFCSDAQCDSVRGFLRAPDGTFTVFDAPGSPYATSPTSIESSGEVAGTYITGDFSAQHGFVRAVQGGFITFDPPGAAYTTPLAINDSGTVAGNYCDASGVCHGFVWTQHP